ncbi:flavin-containing amine oxidoreductase-domain containing protein [Phascolomyces articulosus]|uniref:Flavin-containing amine oxidoreductase-domain containing protein n=1 Tax=Phascolomyces articulosus TaxID=60185 RepID=A0AAD5JML2_9FUNG|nr:flavin-containing amine oxidoreductase-domain containing protein [Phascolomyces articulosus]
MLALASQYHHFQPLDDTNYYANVYTHHEEADTPTIESESLTNIHLNWNCGNYELNNEEVQGNLILSIGACGLNNNQNIANETINKDAHHVIGSFSIVTTINSAATTSQPQQYCHQQRKFIWAVPPLETLDMHQGCLFAIHGSSNRIYAKSKQYSVSPSNRFTINREQQEEQDKFDKQQQQKSQLLFDMYFDGVTYFKHMMAKKHVNRNYNDAFMEVDPILAKEEKKIGIIGAGASGLFSAYLLMQAGYKNIEIVEGNDRIGGRIKTAYFDKSKAVYNELGAMRIPTAWRYRNETTMLPIHEHRIVLQVSKELNKINKNEKDQIKFIPFIDHDDNNLAYFNGFRLPDGRIPTKKEFSDMTGSLHIYPGALANISREAFDIVQPFKSVEILKTLAQDFYGTFKKAIYTFGDQWSERDWLYREMNASTSAVDFAIQLKERMDIWDAMCSAFFTAETNAFQAIYGGMSRLPEALLLALGDKKIIKYNTLISKIEYIDHEGKKDNDTGTTTMEKTISIQWKNRPFDRTFNSKEFDNVIISAPFAVVRSWHLPQELPYTIKSAIRYLKDVTACKVLLEFESRFWEHDQDHPIFGGCSNTDLPTTDICYPSNDLGSEGPAVMIASYVRDDLLHLGALSDEEHVARILEDVVELHGDIAYEQYTGRYARQCWGHDPFARAAWAMYTAAHRRLLLPSYYEYLDGLVFVGEHTHIYQSWISSALHSAIRGVIMILIEHGDIDGAKNISNHWNTTSYVHI